MKLFTKIFLFGMLVFGAAFSASGYFLLHHALESSVSREADFALKQYQYDKFTVQSALLTYCDVSVVTTFKDDDAPWDTQICTIWEPFPDVLSTNSEYYFAAAPFLSNELSSPSDAFSVKGLSGNQLSENFFQTLASEISVPAAFFSEDKTLLYSEIEGFNPSFLDSLSENAHTYQFLKTQEGGFVLVGSMLDWDGSPALLQGTEGPFVPAQEQKKIYFVTQWDMSKAIGQHDTMLQYFIRCYLIAMAAGTALLIFLSALLTGPLKKMSEAAGRMAEGYYEERISLKGSGEMKALALSFNQMADSVEDKIAQLSKAAREKEDFVANFAHELKTPLTSIIGYADTIYQRELSREELCKASWHIWTEGMRLESLSQKLMELIVLGRQDFPLTETPITELLQDVAECLNPLLSEGRVSLCLQAEPGDVLMDYDLLKTLLLNLADNSMKAGCSRILLHGTRQEEGYGISVSDDGCGMEEAELSRITEAFYMVDKARSRKLNGAGLGLALADRIAGIHGTSLRFESRKGAGTTVRLQLKYPKNHPLDTDSETVRSEDCCPNAKPEEENT